MPLPLVERSREEISEAIRKKMSETEGIKGVSQLDVRISGKRLDVNMLLLVDANLAWKDAHRIALGAERAVTGMIPEARVFVNTEPTGIGAEGVWKLVRDVANSVPGSRGVHNVHIQRIGGKLYVDMHLEVSSNLTVKQAHDIADQVETSIKASNPKISEVTVHIESASERVSREMAGVQSGIESFFEHVAESYPEIKEVGSVEIRRVGRTVHLVLRCRFDPNLSIEKAHEISSRLEKEIRETYPDVTRIDIHEEPA